MCQQFAGTLQNQSEMLTHLTTGHITHHYMTYYREIAFPEEAANCVK